MASEARRALLGGIENLNILRAVAIGIEIFVNISESQ
jgi:hypothetical protein